MTRIIFPSFCIYKSPAASVHCIRISSEVLVVSAVVVVAAAVRDEVSVSSRGRTSLECFIYLVVRVVKNKDCITSGLCTEFDEPAVLDRFVITTIEHRTNARFNKILPHWSAAVDDAAVGDSVCSLALSLKSCIDQENSSGDTDDDPNQLSISSHYFPLLTKAWSIAE